VLLTLCCGFPDRFSDPDRYVPHRMPSYVHPDKLEGPLPRNGRSFSAWEKPTLGHVIRKMNGATFARLTALSSPWGALNLAARLARGEASNLPLSPAGARPLDGYIRALYRLIAKVRLSPIGGPSFCPSPPGTVALHPAPMRRQGARDPRPDRWCRTTSRRCSRRMPWRVFPVARWLVGPPDPARTPWS
jgi:hypothetical protein